MRFGRPIYPPENHGASDHSMCESLIMREVTNGRGHKERFDSIRERKQLSQIIRVIPRYHSE